MFSMSITLSGHTRPPFEGTRQTLHRSRRDTAHRLWGPVPHVINLPSRDKTIELFGVSGAVSTDLATDFEYLDSKYPDLTQVQKYGEISKDLPGTFYIQVLGTHCGSGIITDGQTPLHFYGAVQNTGTELWIADYDVGYRLRRTSPGSYWLYRMPVVQERACFFWMTQALCSRWWRWTQTFERDNLKCFNALETMLFERKAYYAR